MASGSGPGFLLALSLSLGRQHARIIGEQLQRVTANARRRLARSTSAADRASHVRRRMRETPFQALTLIGENAVRFRPPAFRGRRWLEDPSSGCVIYVIARSRVFPTRPYEPDLLPLFADGDDRRRRSV